MVLNPGYTKYQARTTTLEVSSSNVLLRGKVTFGHQKLYSPCYQIIGNTINIFIYLLFLLIESKVPLIFRLAWDQETA